MKCDCGHDQSHHNPGEDNSYGYFAGNCRNCKCLKFTTDSQANSFYDLGRTIMKGLISRDRGEVIVRRWHDEIADLITKHELELAKRDVMLEEQKRLMRLANKQLVKLERRVAELEEFIVGEAESGSDTHVGKIKELREQ